MMKIKKRVLPALLLSMFAAAAGSASAQQAQFSGVYVFGDSLSDAGYYRPWLTSLGLPAPLVATLGRFTTNPGPVWSEIISSYYGVTPSPSNASGGNIFAQGGARVTADSTSTPPGFAQRPVSTQITEYLARGNGRADSGALYSVWAGGNDFLQNFSAFAAGSITQAELQTNVLAAATAEIGQVGRLRAAGAQYILVFGLPDIGITPFALGAGAAAAAGATQLSAGFNTTLFTGLQSAGFRVIPVDVFTLLNEIRANPAAYGITNVTGVACPPFPPITTSPSAQFCSPANMAPNGDRTYLFADGVHPTTVAHAIVGDFVKSLIEGPAQYGMLAEGAVQAREAHVRSLTNGIALGRQQQVGTFGVFFGGDMTNFEIERGLDTDSKAGTVGVTMRASESVVVGLAYGNASNTGTFGRNLGNYDANETVFSAFGAVRWGGFYGAAAASISDIRFSNIKRTIPMGPAIRQAEGNADGENSSFYFTAGYDWTFGRFTIGPLFSVLSQDVTVNQLDESGAGSANLRIMEQTRKSEVWSVGARASYTFGDWTPWARVTADQERRDDVRLVSAMPLSMAAIGSTYDVPTYRPDSSYMTWGVGVTGRLARNISLSASYYSVESRSGIKQDGVNGLISVSF